MLLIKSKIIITLSIAEEQAGKWQYGKVFGVAAGSDVGSGRKTPHPETFLRPQNSGSCRAKHPVPLSVQL